MRFVLIGAGAIGGVVGGRLSEHGYEVAFVARGAHGAEIERTVFASIPPPAPRR